ncbi:uncharacterized protein K452DRAFT_286112 [Aplosporella prunicola CBS 121167]|uniref:GAR domain-containing protein n=1 Tax=Aplosporella prunicola CBS 121167 TaxID=1176127 RepID=A0A6A6BIN1_9PEZI|nr:uncharacterized protein K452DRAFT_286112 [Aplosporella prunicola CBS 121167]KAF2143283.1 hypothetical protein K452DRAFT_286112 [Aplosporella prunicola CBS 121167]
MLMSRPPEKLTRPTSARGAGQPFRLSGSQFAKHGLLSAANDFTLQEDPAESPKRSGSVAEMMQSGPSLLHPTQGDKGHQRTRSNSEPHLYLPQFHSPRFERTEVGNGPLIEVSNPVEAAVLSASEHMPGESKQSQHQKEESVAPETPDPAGLKRASVASTQSIAPAPVTDISASQNSSSRQAARPPQELYDGSLPALSHGGNASVTDEDEIKSPSRSIDEQSVEVGTPERRYSQEYYPDSSPESSFGGSFEDSPSLRQLPKKLRGRAPPSSLNSTMPKRRAAMDRSRLISAGDYLANFDDYTVFDSSDSPATLSGGLGVPKSNKNRRVSSATEDLEKQIRRIITSVHAPIRLTSGHDSSDSSPINYKPNRNVSGSRPPSSLRVSRTPNAASMTMSPVKPENERSVSARRSVSHGDSGIKLYHLMQPGRDKPIKLFVRRVGENGERVMVRVGGGWADLGEYLRQYVEHHGKRVVSDGKFEVLGIEENQEWNAARPTSSHSSDSVKGGRPGGLPPAPTSNGSTPGMSPTKSSNSVSRPGSAMTTYTPNGMEDIPEIGASGTSQRSWQGSEVGLAGPNTKKLELSEEKLEWIEGMMEQAKRLGTKGANRKVLMKH